MFTPITQNTIKYTTYQLKAKFKPNDRTHATMVSKLFATVHDDTEMCEAGKGASK